MVTAITKVRSRTIPGQIVLNAMILLGVSFTLFIAAISNDDLDLPLYLSEAGIGHYYWIAFCVICWPIVAVARVLGRFDDLWAPPLGFCGVVFWAGLFELLLAVRRPH